MLTALLATVAAVADPCRLELVSAAAGENHVLFHGVSPDGRTVAIGWDKGSGRDTKRGAFLLDLASANRTDLPQLNNAPSFSPDGRYLVSANYAGRELKTEVVELDRRTGQAKSYASGPSLEWLASYAPDGKSILFNSTRTGTSDLYRVARKNGQLTQVTRDPRYEAHGQLYDHGRKMIFHRQVEGDNYDIVIRDLPSGKEQSVGGSPREEAYPAISPNGRRIAFSAAPASGAQVNLYLMGADGRGKARLTAGPSKDAYATWAPNGRAIYFVRFEDGGSKVYRIRMRGNVCVR
jgi:TolB protein